MEKIKRGKIHIWIDKNGQRVYPSHILPDNYTRAIEKIQELTNIYIYNQGVFDILDMIKKSIRNSEVYRTAVFIAWEKVKTLIENQKYIEDLCLPDFNSSPNILKRIESAQKFDSLVIPLLNLKEHRVFHFSTLVEMLKEGGFIRDNVLQKIKRLIVIKNNQIKGSPFYKMQGISSLGIFYTEKLYSKKYGILKLSGKVETINLIEYRECITERGNRRIQIPTHTLEPIITINDIKNICQLM